MVGAPAKPDASAALASLAKFLAEPSHAAASVASLLPQLTAAWAAAPLSREDSTEAAAMLRRHAWRVQGEELRGQWEANAITAAGKTMKFTVKRFGSAAALPITPDTAKPARWPLYISMHGGGGTTAAINDSQWQNQIKLYEPADGLYIAPRAPTDAWNMWHEGHMDALFVALIDAAVILDNVDPDRVYLMGYSAGGDGVYQLAPRMADRFGAAAMMAGHPNDASPLGLRNLPMIIQVGGNDNAFDRANIAKRFGEQITKLREADSKGYVSMTKLYEGKGHWMEKQDVIALPWMAEHKRSLWPSRIVWKQSGVTHNEYYWFSLTEADRPIAGSLISAAVSGQTITLASAEPFGSFPSLTLLLNDQLLDMDKPVQILLAGSRGPLFEGKISRTIASIAASLARRVDFSSPADVSTGRVVVLMPIAAQP